MTSLSHNNIERSTSGLWTKTSLNNIKKDCKAAGYDVITSPETVTIGLEETGQVFLKALASGNGWMVRYDRKLLDENAE